MRETLMTLAIVLGLLGLGAVWTLTYAVILDARDRRVKLANDINQIKGRLSILIERDAEDIAEAVIKAFLDMPVPPKHDPFGNGIQLCDADDPRPDDPRPKTWSP